MMGESRLIRVLDFLGFMCVDGLYEAVGKEARDIERGTPLTRNYSPAIGLTVVYDQQGCAWIRPGRIECEVFDAGLRDDDQAYIPFGNDGGVFVKNFFPTIRCPRVLGKIYEVKIARAASLIFQATSAERSGDTAVARGMLNSALLIEAPTQRIERPVLDTLGL